MAKCKSGDYGTGSANDAAKRIRSQMNAPKGWLTGEDVPRAARIAGGNATAVAEARRLGKSGAHVTVKDIARLAHRFPNVRGGSKTNTSGAPKSNTPNAAALARAMSSMRTR